MTKRLQITGRVDGSLRDRIVAAIQCIDDWRGVTDPAILADAVIEELGLRQEYDPYSEPESSRRRYVTEWEIDD